MDKKNNQARVDLELFSAVEKLDEEGVCAAIDAGADINSMDEESGARPLHRAIALMDSGIVRVLLERGVDVHSMNQQGWKALQLAVQSIVDENFEVIAMLIAGGADINGRSEGGLTALHVAAVHDRGSVCQFLLKQGADIEAVDDEGRSALSWACHGLGSNLTPVLMLIAYGAKERLGSSDPDLNDALKMSALQAAVVLELGDRVLDLLKAGMKPTDRANRGSSALVLAKRQSPAMLGIINSHVARELAMSTLNAIDSGL